MAKLKEDISIRSEEVQDIMNKIPSGLIRNGLAGMFVLVVLGIFLSWFIKYPDIIKGKIILTTAVEPLKLVSQSSGIIVQLYVRDGEEVPAGKVLAEIENPLSVTSADYLQGYLIKLEAALSQNEGELPLPDTTVNTFGDLQSVINGLAKELLVYNISTTLKMDDVEIGNIKSKIASQREMIASNDRIIEITKKEIEDSKIKYEADAKLYKESFISKMDFLQSESARRSKELTLEQMHQSRINQKGALDAFIFQLKQAEYNKYNKVKNNLDAIHGLIKTIRGYVAGWKQKYNLIAMKSGKVNFLQRIQVGSFLKGGEELFAITEKGGMYMGVAYVPTSGYGKIKIDQDVNILLENYPYYEYGILKGKVTSIALFPNTNEYRVQISLPNGMMSSQKQKLNFTPEMLGEAEIITENKRVIERLFDSILKALKRK